ncbi:MAG: ABC transporter permease [Bacteroidaceae bacterium]|nr:ABC transporter permease [Bacteroidaceae bacterium]
MINSHLSEHRKQSQANFGSTESQRNWSIVQWSVIKVFNRECRRLTSDWIYQFGLFVAPIMAFIFFATVMHEGSPTEYPVGVVNMDSQSTTSRNLVRTLNAFQMTNIVEHYTDIAHASSAMQEGKIYGFYYIPRGFSQDANSRKQPILSFYTNNSVLLAASMGMKDFKMGSELAKASAQRQVLRGRGFTDDQAVSLIQPIVIDVHPLGNPWVNYGMYLNNMLLPAILMMMIFLLTTYAMGVEIKEGSGRELLNLANYNIMNAVVGKLLPQTFIYITLGILYLSILYGYLHYPLNNGFAPMLLAMVLFVLASQSVGLFFIALIPTLRLGMSVATLWAVLSFSIAGFTFPVIAMHPSLQALSNLFPLRHYYMIYADQALNGYPMIYSAWSYLALLLFMLLPFFAIKRLNKAYLYYEYIS